MSPSDGGQAHFFTLFIPGKDYSHFLIQSLL